MSLIVEDGTGLATAESYESVVNADAYVNKWYNGDAAWSTATTAQKEAALRQGARYIDGEFGGRWLGTRANKTQALDWPMNDVIDLDGYTILNTVIPQAVKDSNSELAYQSINGAIFFAPDTDPIGVLSERIKVGSIETETEYAGARRVNIATVYPLVGRLLRKLIHASGTLRRA